MRRIFIAVAVLVALAAASLVALPLVLSPSFVADRVSDAVTRATGRSLVFGKAPRLSLWPHIAVEIGDVVLGNPPDMFEGRFATTDKLRLRVGLVPLLQRRLDVHEVILVRPRIALVIDSDGKPNWSFDTGTDAAKTDQGGRRTIEAAAVALAPIVIEDGDVRYLDERTGTALALDHVDVTIEVPDAAGPIGASGHATWKSQRLKLDLYAKAPRRLGVEGSPVDLAIDGALIDASFSGLARLAGGLSLAGILEMETPSLRGLCEWVGKPLAPGRGLAAFALQGALDFSGSAIDLTETTVKLDGMTGQGSLSIETGGKRPAVTASLGLDRLDLNAYAASPSNKGAPAKPAAGDGLEAWSDAPIDLTGLGAFDAKLALAAEQINYRDMVIGKTRVETTVKDGRLIAQLPEMAFYDGNASGEIILGDDKGDAILQGQLTVVGADALRLINDAAGIQRFSGKGNFSLALAARGKNQRELVSTLKGAAALRFSDGAIRGIDLTAMIRNVQSDTLTGWNKTEGKDTDLALLEASYTIEDGIATSDDLKLVGPLVRVTARGSVDLLRRRLDYKVQPTLEGLDRSDAHSGLPVAVIVEGPWTAPRIYPEIAGILDDPKAAYEALRRLTEAGKVIDLKAETAKIGDKATAKPGEAADDDGKALIESDSATRTKP